MKKRKDGRFSRSFTVNGKRIFVYAKTRTELDEKEFNKRLELESQKDKHDNPTLAEFQEKYIENKRSSVTSATIRHNIVNYGYCKEIKIKGVGKFVDMKLKEITVDDIRTVQKEIREDHSTSTTNGAISYLSTLFKAACNERLIDFNPCQPVRTLKRTEELAKHTIHRALSESETDKFFDDIKERSMYYNVYRFALATGLRSGEIGALFVSDIHDGFIHVERTITRGEVEYLAIGDTAKTEAGKRRIPLNHNIRSILKSQQELNRGLFGNKVVSLNDRYFRNTDGGLLDTTVLDAEMRRVCNRIGIPPFTMHAFRATFATRLIAAKVEPRTVQELLGHKDCAITLNLYTHVMNETLTDAMEKTADILAI